MNKAFPELSKALSQLLDQINPTFGLLLEHYSEGAVEWTGIGNEKRKISLFVLSPVDLAVTKILRCSDQDREDIVALAGARLFSTDQLRSRATESLADYIGNRAPAMTSIDLICRQISSEKNLHLDKGLEFPIEPPTLGKDKNRELEI